MKNENNNSYSAKKAVMYFLYILVCNFTIILTIFHFVGSLGTGILNEVLTALIAGVIISALFTHRRIKGGRMAEPIVNMRKYKYWAFTELVFFYFFLMMGVMHLADHDGAYMLKEIIFGVFFGLFCGGVNVLHLIRKEKCTKD